jgi:DNA-binding FadR family transcriptional regulator
MEASTFRTIGNKGSLVDQVVEEIQNLVVNGSLEPGTKLPPERQLAEQIGVSRTVIREAVQILVTKGLLETKHGVGTLVCQVSNNHFAESLNLLLLTHGVTLDDLHHVRSILEVENARLAATQATEADISGLRQILTEMEQVKGDAQSFADKDTEFHTALAKTSHNPLMIVLLDSIREPMQEIRLSVSRYPDLFATVMPDHALIIERVAARDALGACRAMQAHLDHARTIQEKFLAQQTHA